MESPASLVSPAADLLHRFPQMATFWRVDASGRGVGYAIRGVLRAAVARRVVPDAPAAQRFSAHFKSGTHGPARDVALPGSVSTR
jgi:hypothetical protein